MIGLGVPEVIIIFLLGLFLFGFIAVIAVTISWRSKGSSPGVGDNAALQDRVSRLEQKLDAIQRALAIDSPAAGPLPPDARAAILDLIRRGNKIEAIKVMREKTGFGLKEAKDAVEAMEREG